MTSEEATAWIHSRLAFGQRPGLMRVEALLKRMGNPEKHNHDPYRRHEWQRINRQLFAQSLEEAGQQVGTLLPRTLKRSMNGSKSMDNLYQMRIWWLGWKNPAAGC